MKEERLKVSFLGTPQKGKSTRNFWGKRHQKKKTMRKQGKDQPSKWLARHRLWYPGEQRKGISGTPEPWDDIIKGEASNSGRGILQERIKTKSLKKLCQKTQRK